MLRRLLTILAAGMLSAPWAFAFQDPNAVDTTTLVHRSRAQAPTVSRGCLTIHGIIGSGSHDLAGTSGIQNGRLFRDGVPSTVDSPKASPAVFDSNPYSYDAYLLTNRTSAPRNITLNLNVQPGVNSSYLHLGVYNWMFNPNKVDENYLGDSGSSAAPGEEVSLSVTVPAGQAIVAVVSTPLGNHTGTPYTLVSDSFCVFFDRSYLDDRGWTMICYNSETGDYMWTILSGPLAGTIYTGTAIVFNGGNTLVSMLMDPQKLYFHVNTQFGQAFGALHWGSAISSVLGDINIYDDPPSFCFPDGRANQ